MINSNYSLTKTIIEAYANRGITITELAESRIRRHIFRNAQMVDDFTTSRVPQLTLPPLSAHLFADMSATELNALSKSLSIELGMLILVTMLRQSGLPFFAITLKKIPPRRRLNNDNY